VPDLDQVIDLCAICDFGFAYSGPVNAGVGLYVNVVANPRGSRLGNFLPMALAVLGKSEAVGSDDGSVFEGDMVA
jgi:hypothetical protein